MLDLSDPLVLRLCLLPLQWNVDLVLAALCHVTSNIKVLSFDTTMFSHADLPSNLENRHARKRRRPQNLRLRLVSGRQFIQVWSLHSFQSPTMTKRYPLRRLYDR